MKVEQTKDGINLVIKLIGAIDEDVIFPKIITETGGTVTFDFGEATHINSCGIREWIAWVNPIATSQKITYKLCPKVIVDQVNTVEGFLPKGGVVESFYVPYYCESCGKTTTFPFETSKVIDGGKVNVPKEATCAFCKKLRAEIDVVAKYFSFLGHAR